MREGTYLDNQIVFLSRRAEGLVWRSRKTKVRGIFHVLSQPVCGLGGCDNLISRAVAPLARLVRHPHASEAVASALLGNGSVDLVDICIQAFRRHFHIQPLYISTFTSTNTFPQNTHPPLTLPSHLLREE